MQEDSFTDSSDKNEELKAVKANDDKTLQRLYQHNYRYVESFVLQNNGSVEQAKDIYQEAFIAMWRNVQADRFVYTPTATLDAYLVRIARNKWLDYVRSADYKRTKALQEEMPEAIIEAAPFDADDLLVIKEVKEKMQQLGDNCREVLTRFYYRQESLRQIAAFFEWTETTVRNNKYRCMERLRILLKNLKRS